MKLNWFSPLPPAKTEIAHHIKRLLPTIARAAEVTFWTDQPTWDSDLDKFATIRNYRFPKLPWVELNHADMTVYELGNNPDFHGTIWQVSRQLSGVVVLHDFCLHHFFDGMYRVKFRNRDSYLALMAKYYGEEGRRDAAICYQSDGRNIDYMAEHYPLTQFALEGALGVLVHNKDVFAELARNGSLPVAYAGLPFHASGGVNEKKVSRSDDLCRLVLFGYIGRNRRLNSVLRALSELPEKDRFRLEIFGQIIEDERKIRAQISTLKLDRIVRVRGFTPEAELDQALAEANLAINLRYPTMGEASASQLRIWAHHLPSLVTRVGWYSTLPADAVAFVRPDENEIQDITVHLRSLLANPATFSEMGERGHRELVASHSPDVYVQTLIRLAEEAKSFRSEATGIALAERAARAAAAWIPEDMRSDTFRRVAGEVCALAKRR